jgi:hypothetical protein
VYRARVPIGQTSGTVVWPYETVICTGEQAPSTLPVLGELPNVGVNVFGDHELGDILEDHSFVSVRTSSHGTIQWVRAKRG